MIKTENSKLLMLTEHFDLYVDSSNNYQLFFKGKNIRFLSQENIFLDQTSAFYIPLNELNLLPFAVSINDPGKNTEMGYFAGHKISLVDYSSNSTVVSFLVVGPRDDEETPIKENPMNDDYLITMFELVKSDPRFIMDVSHDFWGDPTGEKQEFFSSEGINYSPYGPFTFYTEIVADNYGEVALQADGISYELNKKVIKQMISEGKI